MFKETDRAWLGESLKGIFNPNSDIWLIDDHRHCYLTPCISVELDYKQLLKLHQEFLQTVSFFRSWYVQTAVSVYWVCFEPSWACFFWAPMCQWHFSVVYFKLNFKDQRRDEYLVKPFKYVRNLWTKWTNHSAQLCYTVWSRQVFLIII